jgi:hypothetical protein
VAVAFLGDGIVGGAVGGAGAVGAFKFKFSVGDVVASECDTTGASHNLHKH